MPRLRKSGARRRRSRQRWRQRFGEPTSGGWADVLVNFHFAGDPSMIVELQVQHETLVRVRTEGHAHQKYNLFRVAYELLETIGEPPAENEFRDAYEERRKFSLQARASTIELQADSQVASQAASQVAEMSAKLIKLELRMDQMEQQNAQLMAALEQQKANEMWFEALLRRASPR